MTSGYNAAERTGLTDVAECARLLDVFESLDVHNLTLAVKCLNRWTIAPAVGGWTIAATSASMSKRSMIAPFYASPADVMQSVLKHDARFSEIDVRSNSDEHAERT